MVNKKTQVSLSPEQWAKLAEIARSSNLLSIGQAIRHLVDNFNIDDEEKEVRHEK